MSHKIYCDEHGNTGERLLDDAQPVFTLASNDFSIDEAAGLVSRLVAQGASEVKFKTLRKTPAGRARLIECLFDPRLNPDRIAVFAMDKPFMVITKMVDLVMEALLHEQGDDLYENGGNLAASNMMAICLPVYCGESLTKDMLEAFVALVRFRQPEQVEQYVAAGQALLTACKDKQMRSFMQPFFARELIAEWLPSESVDHLLDPAIPTLFQVIDTWGRRKTDRFEVIHDQSKPVLASEAQFHAMMAQANEASKQVGYDRRTFLYPLRATGLQMGDSTTYPQLQIADMCAGLTAHWLRHHQKDSRDELCKAFESANGPEWLLGCVGPSAHVTPQDLGTDSREGTNPVDPIVEHLRGKLG